MSKSINKVEVKKSVANKYFKVCNTDLECVTGYTIGNDLYLGLQPINDRRSSTGVWVITKKAR